MDALICSVRPESDLLWCMNYLSFAWSAALILVDCYKAVSISTFLSSSRVWWQAPTTSWHEKSCKSHAHQCWWVYTTRFETQQHDSLLCALHFVCVSKLYTEVPSVEPHSYKRIAVILQVMESPQISTRLEVAFLRGPVWFDFNQWCLALLHYGWSPQNSTGSISSHLPTQPHCNRSLKSATAGVVTPRKLANTADQCSPPPPLKSPY